MQDHSYDPTPSTGDESIDYNTIQSTARPTVDNRSPSHDRKECSDPQPHAHRAFDPVPPEVRDFLYLSPKTFKNLPRGNDIGSAIDGEEEDQEPVRHRYISSASYCGNKEQLAHVGSPSCNELQDGAST